MGFTFVERVYLRTGPMHCAQRETRHPTLDLGTLPPRVEFVPCTTEPDPLGLIAPMTFLAEIDNDATH